MYIALDGPIGWPRYPILCMILQIKLDVNKKYEASRGELLVHIILHRGKKMSRLAVCAKSPSSVLN